MTLLYTMRASDLCYLLNSFKPSSESDKQWVEVHPRLVKQLNSCRTIYKEIEFDSDTLYVRNASTCELYSLTLDTKILGFIHKIRLNGIDTNFSKAYERLAYSHDWLWFIRLFLKIANLNTLAELYKVNYPTGWELGSSNTHNDLFRKESVKKVLQEKYANWALLNIPCVFNKTISPLDFLTLCQFLDYFNSKKLSAFVNPGFIRFTEAVIFRGRRFDNLDQEALNKVIGSFND